MSPRENWTAMKKLKHSLLRRAFDENRGAEVILMIQWRLAHERYKNEGGVKALRAFERENAGQARSIRALNLIAAEKGIEKVYKEQKSFMRTLREMPDDQRIMVEPRQTLANSVLCFGVVGFGRWMFEKKVSKTEEDFSEAPAPVTPAQAKLSFK